MKFAVKNRFFFSCKVIVGYKMKIKGVVEDLKIKKSFLIKKIIIAKIYLEISLVLLWTVWGQFIFR